MRKILYPRILILLLGIIIYQFSYSQEYAGNWISGNFGIVFEDTIVSIRKDNVSVDSRGAGIISDADGHLLFYTNGLKVWNKNHEIMPHGDSILFEPFTTSTQESLIVPQPNSGSIFYIFTTDPWNGQETSGLYYSVVDINRDNGKGDVIAKRVRLLEGGSNKITAVYHQNNKDVWIITQQHNTNLFYSILLTSSGISNVPVVSAVGKTISSNFDGQLKASPDGKRVACSYDDNGHGFGLFDFNNSSGELSNPMNFTLPISYRTCEALEFSPDAKKLFVYQGGSTGESGLFQYNLSSSLYEEINKSRFFLYSETYNSFRQMQLAPDGKIYITKGGGGGGTEHLGVIEHTNEIGNNCVVKENGLYLEGQSSFVASTPNFIQNYFFRTSFEWNQTCQTSPVSFDITNVHWLDSVKWHFGEGNTSKLLKPKITFKQAGDYKISLIAYYPDKTDTIKKTITIYPFSVFDLGRDTTVCSGHTLRITEKFTRYHWNNGDTTSSISVQDKGKYKLTVRNSHGCFSSDSILIDVAALPVINLPDTIEAVTLDSVELNAGDFLSYSWNTGATTASIYVKEEGWYSVVVSNESQCVAASSVFVQRNNLPQNGESTDWIVLNPKPTLNTGTDIYFLNKLTGFIVTDKELIKTDDGGLTWKKSLNLASGKRIAFKNSIGYIIGNGGSIYKSTHNGVGWNKISTGFTDDLNAISVIHPDTLFVTCDQKLFVSYNGGKTWKSILINGVNIEDSYFTSSKTGHIACTYGEILKTKDGGNTWYVTETSNEIPSNFFRITFVNEQVGYASQEHSEIYKTTDGGETWKEIASLDAAYGIFFFNKDTGYIAGEYGAIHKTTDGGKTWQWKGSNGRIDGNNLYGIFFLNEEKGFVTGLRGRILNTQNGGITWSEYATNYNNVQKLQFTSINQGYALIGNSLFGTYNRGEDWIRRDPLLKDFDFTDDNNGYAISTGTTAGSWISNRVYKTMDGGKTWTKTGDITASFYGDLRYIDFIDSQTGFVSTGPNGGSYKTSDGGVTWELLSVNGLIQFQFLNSQAGYAIGNYTKLYKSNDGGKTWNLIFDNSEDIRSFHFTDELHGYITGDNALMYRTDNGGNSWKKLEVPYEYYTKVRFSTNNVGYLLDEDGILLQTEDAGATWKNIHNMYGIRLIELRDEDIYIAGNYGRILRNTISCDSVSVSLKPVKNPMSKRATLKGVVASNNKEISDIQFQYAPDMSFGNMVKANPEMVQSGSADSVYADITGLKANTRYYYWIKYKYNGKEYTSGYAFFVTPSEYEMVMSYVNSYHCDEQQLEGRITSNGADITMIKFQYGKDTLFTQSVDASPGFVPGENMLNVTGKIVNLEPATNYYCRLKALYQGNIIYSKPLSFQTKPENDFYFFSPVMDGMDAKVGVQISAFRDTLNSIEIEYGKTREYLHHLPASPNQVHRGQTNYAEATFTGLQANTAYFYRAKAKQGTKTIYSKENILNLTGGVVIEPATILQNSNSSILLQGLIHSGGKYLYTIQFEYGTTPELGDSVKANSSSNFDPTRNIYFLLQGLTPSTKYYFRIKASDGKTFYYSDLYSYTLGVLTEVQKAEELQMIRAYPNPAYNFIFIDSPKKVDHIEFLDIQGKVIDLKIDGQRADISGLPVGIYFIRIFTSNGVVNLKIMKL